MEETLRGPQWGQTTVGPAQMSMPEGFTPGNALPPAFLRCFGAMVTARAPADPTSPIVSPAEPKVPIATILCPNWALLPGDAPGREGEGWGAARRWHGGDVPPRGTHGFGSVFRQAGEQAADPEWLVVPPRPRDHPPALAGHRGGQAALLQALRRLCTGVSPCGGGRLQRTGAVVSGMSCPE